MVDGNSVATSVLSGKLAASMDDVYNLDAVSGNPIQNDVVWVRHDLT